MHLHKLSLTVAILPFCLQCLTPAADRARRDETVGRADAQNYSVHVKDGLAVVRSATPDLLSLWQSAPAFEFTLELGALPLVLEVNNAMPEASLVLLAGEATIESQSAEQSKRRRWQLTPHQSDTLTFALLPKEPKASPFRFALMSDVQEAIDSVQDVFNAVNRVRDLDFLLGAGDLTQRGERAQLERFERELSELTVPYYTTLGNHELGVDPPLFHDFFGRGSFSFEHRGARFTLIDSASATIDQRTYAWLKTWLNEGSNQFHTLAMHIPPIDPTGTRNGAFASRDEAIALFAELQTFGVDLTVYGHVHSFYDFDNAGIPAIISGGGGAIPERFDNIGRHFVVFNVDPERQTFTKELVRVD